MKRVGGALVAEAQTDGPAAKAGIVPGDVITSVDAHVVANATDLAVKIGGTAPGTTVKVGVIHAGNERTLSVTLGELPVTPFKAAAASPQPESSGPSGLGLGLAPAATIEGAGDKGVVVTDVDPNGHAAEKGLVAGDIILDISGRPVNTLTDIRNAISQARGDGKHDILMRVKTGNERNLFVAISIAAPRETLWGKIRSWIHSL